jgi:hypothetical protein
VDDFIMWKIATRSLAELRPTIVAMIEHGDRATGNHR